MNATLYGFLSHWWSGVAIAAAVILVGALLIRLARRSGRRVIRWLGWLVAAFGVALLTGAGYSVRIVRRAQARYPAPGRLVDVGGYRMHLVAEGEARGRPTVVWIAGAHEAGLNLYHLHRAMRQETRSILFDRPGTGWSDQGPFPRRTGREAEELATLLERAGEAGPFVVVGHSYGGLLAANFARRYPEKTAAVVLADGTPPDVFEYLPDGGGPAIPDGLARAARRTAWRRLFGLDLRSDRVPPPVTGDTAMTRLLRTIDERLAEVNDAIHSRGVGPDWASASIFEEWRDPKAVADLMVYDHELDSLPVYVVIPAGKEQPPTVRAIGVSAGEAERALAFLEQSRMRYLRTSVRSELIHTPPGTGHNYPYETPEVLLDAVRRALGEGSPPADTTDAQ